MALSLQEDTDKQSQRLKISEEKRTAMEAERDRFHTELNHVQTQHNTQAQRNVELHKSQRATEKDAHELRLALQHAKEEIGRISSRAAALEAKNTALADRLAEVEMQQNDMSREVDALRAQAPALKAAAHAAEEQAAEEERLRLSAEVQGAMMVYTLDKAEAAVKQKDAEIKELRLQVAHFSESVGEQKKTIEQQESKLMDFKQWLHEIKQQVSMNHPHVDNHFLVERYVCVKICRSINADDKD